MPSSVRGGWSRRDRASFSSACGRKEEERGEGRGREEGPVGGGWGHGGLTAHLVVGLDLAQVLHAEVRGPRALRCLLQHQRLRGAELCCRGPGEGAVVPLLIPVWHQAVPSTAATQWCLKNHPTESIGVQGSTQGCAPQLHTWMRRMTAWCILHMWARDGLSIRISTAWMGPAGLRSFMAT